MPIRQLDDQIRDGRRDLPVIGFLAKGDYKQGNKPGADLDHWRFTAQDGYEQLEQMFLEVYGVTDAATGEIKPPSVLPIRLPANLDDGLNYWLEERAGDKATLIHRCDGVNQIQWYDGAKKQMSRQRVTCAANAAQPCHCSFVVYLKVMLPGLIAESGVWGVVLLRTSSRIDVEHIVKFTKALNDDLRGTNMRLNNVDLLLSRVPETIPYEDKSGAMRQKEHYMVKMSFSPAWIKSNFALLSRNVKPAAVDDDSPAAPALGNGNGNTGVKSADYDSLDALCNRYLKMSLPAFYSEYMLDRNGANQKVLTLKQWLEECDDGYARKAITAALIQKRIPVYLYGVRVEKKQVTQRSSRGVNVNETYFLHYRFGFDKAGQYGREPFKEVAEMNTEHWLNFAGVEGNYKDIPFERPTPVYLTHNTDGSPRVAAIAWDLFEYDGDSAPALDSEQDEQNNQPPAPPVADANEALLDMAYTLLGANDYGQAQAALMALPDAVLSRLADEIGIPDTLENEYRPTLIAAILKSADLHEQDNQPPAPPVADDSDLFMPRSAAHAFQFTVAQLTALAQRQKISLEGARSKLDIIKVLSKALNLPEN